MGWTNGNGNGGTNGNAGGNGNGNNQCKTNNGNGNGNNTSTDVYEEDQYFFHPDHLGSSSYVTDADGEIFQHLEYFPFGETFVEEHSNTQRTPYLFTAKELDEETGLYYFGARYYDPRTSVWQSPDPILAKYLPTPGESASRLAGMGGVFTPVNLNLYAYSHNRPVIMMDPDGMEPLPLTNSQLRGLVYSRNGMIGSGRLTQLTGDVFENAVLRSLNLPKNTESFGSDFRTQMSQGLKNLVVPDAIRLTKTFGAKRLFGFLPVPQTYVGLDFLDAKTTSGKRSLSQSYDRYQLSGFIDAIAAGTMDGGQGVLELVTTQETNVGNGLIDYATERGVAIWQRRASYDSDTGMFNVEAGELLNPSVLGERQPGPLPTGNGKAVPLFE